MLRGREQAADAIVRDVERRAEKQKARLPRPSGDKLTIAVRDHTPWRDVFANMLGENRGRFYLALVLMVGQSFFFNAVFFTYGLVVKRFYGVSENLLPLHLLPFAASSFFGPLVLGHLFDKVGRKPMIAGTYGIAGLLLAGVCFPFARGALSLGVLDVWFSVIFLVASSAASAAYLTVSEIFPLEIRAFAIVRLLRTRHAHWRRRRAVSLRSIDRDRLEARGCSGLRGRGRADDHGGHLGARRRGRSGWPVARVGLEIDSEPVTWLRAGAARGFSASDAWAGPSSR